MFCLIWVSLRLFQLYTSRIGVYFPWCLPTLLALSATSKSPGIFQPSPYPPDASRGVKTQRVTARNTNVHISTEEQGVRRPTDNHKSNPLAIQHRHWESGTFVRECMQALLNLWTTYPQCYVARVDNSNSRQTTSRSASDNVFANLFAIFIGQVSGAANLEKNVVPVLVPYNKESCFAQPIWPKLLSEWINYVKSLL